MRYLLLIIAAVALVSCGNPKEKDNIKTYHLELSKTDIDIEPLIEIISISDLGNDSIPISNMIRKFDMHNDIIYILDAKTSKILLFDINGKFVNQLDARGGGAGEYTELRDFCIDKKSDEIHILDYSRLLCYDINSLKYKSTKNLNFKESGINSSYFAMFGEDTIYMFDGADFNALEQSGSYLSLLLNGKSISLNKRTIYYESPWGEKFITLNDGYLFIAPEVDYLVYKIDRDGVKKRYRFDFGVDNLPLNSYATSRAEWEKQLDNKYIKDISDIKESDDNIFATVFGPGMAYSVIIINKSDDSYVSGKCGPNTIIPIYCKDNVFYALVDQMYARSNPLFKDYYIANANMSQNSLLVKFKIKQ